LKRGLSDDHTLLPFLERDPSGSVEPGAQSPISSDALLRSMPPHGGDSSDLGIRIAFPSRNALGSFQMLKDAKRRGRWHFFISAIPFALCSVSNIVSTLEECPAPADDRIFADPTVAARASVTDERAWEPLRFNRAIPSPSCRLITE
jgi:hypothetical protein